MAAEENLSPDQFAKKKRWVPDQLGHLASWHVLKWHVNGNGSVGRKEAHDIHMQMHAEGKFADGMEHEHFTPKR